MTAKVLAVPTTIDEAIDNLQIAIGVEFGTLPPYLYAMFSIPPGENVASAALIKSVLMQEMIHMCLACNILSALGGTPDITPPAYPGPLPGNIGPDGKVLTVSLLPFSEAAMEQAMNIERPEKKPDFPIVEFTAVEAAPQAVTIGQFYEALDALLATLDPNDWVGGPQIDGSQFFPGQLFPVNSYNDAHRAISIIVSEGEGASDDPLDFTAELAHYYRFGEVYYGKVLNRVPGDPGYQWGPETIDRDWNQVYPAIPDPQTHDFSQDPPAAQAAQQACNIAYSQMVDALRLAMTGHADQLGVAVRAMFDLRMAAKAALLVPLADGHSVSGPAFVYLPNTPGAPA